MRKTEYSARVRDAKHADTARSMRYKHTAASARTGHNDSSHSLREIASRQKRSSKSKRRGRAHYTAADVEAAEKKYNSSAASKFGKAKLDRSINSWYAVVIGRSEGYSTDTPSHGNKSMVFTKAAHTSIRHLRMPWKPS